MRNCLATAVAGGDEGIEEGVVEEVVVALRAQLRTANAQDLSRALVEHALESRENRERIVAAGGIQAFVDALAGDGTPLTGI